MNNDELKKKIISALQSVEFVTEKGWCGQCISLRLDYSAIADALIAAGIGDVSSEKAMRELAEAFYREKCAEYDLLNYQMQKSEYRIAEAKHHVEVAEMALKIVCRMQENLNILVDGKPWTKEEIYNRYIEQAEKELAEERKDE